MLSASRRTAPHNRWKLIPGSCKTRPQTMLGADNFTESLFTMRRLENFVPADHLLRPIRGIREVGQLLLQITSPRKLDTAQEISDQRSAMAQLATEVNRANKHRSDTRVTVPRTESFRRSW